MGTSYARAEIADEHLDRIAERLGVTPSVFIEARVRVLEELEARGLGRPKRSDLVRTTDERLYQYRLYMPPVVWAAWKEECQFRMAEGTVMLRSLIYHYLTHEREPQPAGAWRFRGAVHRMGEQARVDYLERATITRGAKRALTRRATRQGARATHVVRALVLELLNQATPELPLIEAGQMYDDETRYHLG